MVTIQLGGMAFSPFPLNTGWNVDMVVIEAILWPRGKLEDRNQDLQTQPAGCLQQFFHWFLGSL